MANKLTELILRKIRSRTEEAPPSDQQSSAPSGPTAPVSLREAQFADFDNVSAMNGRLGQGADSLENWYRLWRDNPALQRGRTPRIGWVLESGGAIVGFLGSIPLDYTLDGTALAAAATCRLAVEPAYRSSTHLLVTSFFRQKDVDLFLNTTATVAAGKIMAALRATQIPQADYGEVLFWILQPQRFASAVLRKTGISSALGKLGGAVAAAGLAAEGVLRGRAPKARSAQWTVREIGVSEIGAEFEAFCAAREKASPQLFAKRSAETMSWHFQPPGSQKSARVLLCTESGRLVGYAIVRHEPEKDGLQRSMIADLMAEANDPAIVGALLSAAYTSAKSAGSDVLEVMGFPKKVRAALRAHRPYSRQYPACPYFFKARERALQEKLATEEVWYGCPFDGDATLWP